MNEKIGLSIVAAFVLAAFLRDRLTLWAIRRERAERRAKRAIFRKMGLECLLGNPPKAVEPKDPPFCVAPDKDHAKVSDG